jgi:hypothetical protein
VLSRIVNVMRDAYADIVVNTGGVRTNLRRLRTKIADTRALSAARRDESWLAEAIERIGPCRRRLRGRYSQYTDFVSNPGNTVATVVSSGLCVVRDLRPASVLDLGSGFSSYVVSTYQAESTHPVLVRRR